MLFQSGWGYFLFESWLEGAHISKTEYVRGEVDIVDCH